MAVKDIRSELRVTAGNVAVVTGNGTTNGVGVDTADFELGLMISTAALNFTDGTYDFTFEESDTGAFAGEETAITDADPDRLIGTIAGLQLTAGTANSDVLPTLGIISNKRFVRANAVASSVTTGADILVMFTEMGEESPVVTS